MENRPKIDAKGIEEAINKRRATRSHKNGRGESLFWGDLGEGMDYGLEAIYRYISHTNGPQVRRILKKKPGFLMNCGSMCGSKMHQKIDFEIRISKLPNLSSRVSPSSNLENPRDPKSIKLAKYMKK